MKENSFSFSLTKFVRMKHIFLLIRTPQEKTEAKDNKSEYRLGSLFGVKQALENNKERAKGHTTSKKLSIVITASNSSSRARSIETELLGGACHLPFLSVSRLLRFLFLFSSSESSVNSFCSYSWTTNQPASLLSANLISFCRLRIRSREVSKNF